MAYSLKMSLMPAVSMPSAQTFAPKSLARSAIVLMSSLSRLSSSILATKLWSILMMSNGSSLTMPTEENPVPKSSRAIRMPLAFRLAVTFLRSLISSSLQRSVTSKQR